MEEILNFNYSIEQKEKIDELLKNELEIFKQKIIILNYASEEKIINIINLKKENNFYLKEVRNFSKEIIDKIFEEKEDILIYNLENVLLDDSSFNEIEMIKREYENFYNEKIDGEIICSAFLDEKVNFIKNNSQELTINIEIDDLRKMNIYKILGEIYKVKNYNKIIVDVADYYDLKVFTICLLKAINLGKKFIIRGRESLIKILASKNFVDKINNVNKKISFI